MAEIKAIETEYAGYRFRSRLEARWAVFFDGMGFTWEYEPEGFVLEDGTWYLPDFRVYTPQGEPMWYEVKPANVLEDAKFSQFAKMMEEGYNIDKPFRGDLLSGDPILHLARFHTRLSDWTGSEIETEPAPNVYPRCGDIGRMGHLRGDFRFHCPPCAYELLPPGAGRGVCGTPFTNACGDIDVEPNKYDNLKRVTVFALSLREKPGSSVGSFQVAGSQL